MKGLWLEGENFDVSPYSSYCDGGNRVNTVLIIGHSGTVNRLGLG